ncbi:Gfo/Idh/MocA family protein [Pararhizobium mangrovi]|uniref:Gfo/Idh/MocA family oxidoreductase n=1 Tax=Pararhizobium mangrovi TaxID=2590452 RepID=A0A506U947_9HYPH|nr:Gfo/Idh/MocA family oxidoreductase [Pararhizobium mangrovi]TPW28367.1 Gfo/Idh/MocA family oxidoreductase [Pararhizobium mangrovi]
MTRVAIVGCGDMGTKHAAAWSVREGIEIAAVCDLDPDRRRSLSQAYGAAQYEAYADAVRHEGVDVVSVCTPAKFHCEVAIHAASAGRHVLCEKPMALSLEEADRMIAAAEANGVALAICHQYRGASQYVTLKSLADEGVFGSPIYLRFSEMREVRPKLAMHERSLSGGPIHDMAGHLFDLMRFLTQSEAESVVATGTVFGSDKARLASIGAFGTDTAEIQARFAGGHCLSIGISWGLPEGTPGHSSETILGPNGMAFVEDPSTPDRNLGARSDTTRVVVKNAGGTRVIACREGPDGPDICIANLLHSIETGRANPFEGRQGRKALELILASRASMESGRIVRLNHENVGASKVAPPM